MPTRRAIPPLLAVLLLVSGCEPSPVPDGPAPAWDPFHPDHVLQIEIWMDDDDWDELRGQTRHYLDLIGASCLVSPPTKRFTWFPANIIIDGDPVSDVGVRKKGFYGSVSDEKPSLKIEFDEFVDGQRFGDLRRMTLNNNLADASQIKQCLGYDLYAQAGVPAPRCSFATVSVNGDPLGIYTHVEPIKKPFLARHFDDDAGNLYEGALSDFRPGWVDVFERKTNRGEPDRSDIETLVPALAVGAPALLETIEPLVDLPRFFEMWAMDVLLMHGDGYARNTNNFYLYRDPTTQRFTFIPWGIDVILEPDRARSWEQAPPPGVAWAEGVLARRLYQHPASQAEYLATLERLLSEVWVEDEILAEIDRMQDLLAPHITEYQEFISESVEAVREYVRTRRVDLDEILAQPPVPWDRPLRAPWCLGTNGAVSAVFDGTWEDEGDGAIELLIDGESVAGEAAFITGFDGGEAVVQWSLRVDDQRSMQVRIPIDPDVLDETMPQEIAVLPGDGTLAEVTEPTNGEPATETLRAFLDGATLTFSAGGTDPGEPLVGTLDAVLYPVME